MAWVATEEKDKEGISNYDLMMCCGSEDTEDVKKVTTAKCRRVRIVNSDRKSFELPTTAVITEQYGHEYVSFTVKGRTEETEHSKEHLQKKECWINLYKVKLHKTKEGAITSEYDDMIHVGTTKLSLEE